MRFRNARKLHNGDEVKIKKSGEVATIIRSYTLGNMVMLEVQSPMGGYHYTNHLEVD